jgi:type 1 glutamine amidotransferase
MMAGRFLHRPPDFLPVRYVPVPGTPMAGGMPPFEHLDEHYLTICDREKATVFLESSSSEGESPAGWYRRYGNGKICALAPCHPSEATRIPEVGPLLLRCLQWCSQEEVK